MKHHHHFIITIAIFCSLTYIHSQSIINTLGGDTAADKFVVENNDSEVGLVVTGEGNVGIGTSNPITNLDINGESGLLLLGIHGSGDELNLGSGTRMHFYPKKSAFRVGYIHNDIIESSNPRYWYRWDDEYIGEYSIAMGKNSLASGNASISIGDATSSEGVASTAMGFNTWAQGDWSVALGRNTWAVENASVSIGSNTKALGFGSTALGHFTEAEGIFATSLGYYTKAESYGSFAVGSFNVGSGDPYSWVDNDPIFEIGIGENNEIRKNALTVLKNGNVGFGTEEPNAKLHIVENSFLDDNYPYTNIKSEVKNCPDKTCYGIDSYLITQVTGAGNIYGIKGTVIGGNDNYGLFGDAEGIGNNYGVYGYADGYGFAHGLHGEATTKYSGGIGVYGSGDGSDFWAEHGSYGNTSSIRWKNNIVRIENPLEKLAQIRGVYFDWDQDHGGKHAIGVIAEEVGKVLPEIVIYEENSVFAKGLDYSKLTPLLIEAVKEQQKIITDLMKRIEYLESYKK